ncbi:hypothetical protein [Pseudomonas prosekii]|nr:hypothetical protein [Pseudomonas prosekii]
MKHVVQNKTGATPSRVWQMPDLQVICFPWTIGLIPALQAKTISAI